MTELEFLRAHIERYGALPDDLAAKYAADGRDVRAIALAIRRGHTLPTALRANPPTADVVRLVRADGSTAYAGVSRRVGATKLWVRWYGDVVLFSRGVGTGALEGWRVAT